MAAQTRDFARLLSYAKPYRVRLGLVVVSLLLGTGFALASPQLVRLLIDAAFVDRDTSRLNRAAILLVTVFAGQTGFGFLRQYLLTSVGERVIADLRLQVYTHLMTLPLGFFSSRRVGELTSRLASDVTVLETVTSGSLAELLRQGLLLAGGVAIIAVTSPRLTLVMLSTPVVIGIDRLRPIRCRISTGVQDQLAEAPPSSKKPSRPSRRSIVRAGEYERLRYRRPPRRAAWRCGVQPLAVRSRR